MHCVHDIMSTAQIHYNYMQQHGQGIEYSHIILMPLSKVKIVNDKLPIGWGLLSRNTANRCLVSAKL